MFALPSAQQTPANAEHFGMHVRMDRSETRRPCGKAFLRKEVYVASGRDDGAEA
jgi:hypothetical protein